MEKDVLIAGAGPVGLVMAIELARYGVAVRIIAPFGRGPFVPSPSQRGREKISGPGISAEDIIRRALRLSRGVSQALQRIF
jgi:2-polyprenyl-6-methoxyphenol hydroxylase-like FAD-dependent oxidoreductase